METAQRMDIWTVNVLAGSPRKRFEKTWPYSRFSKELVRKGRVIWRRGPRVDAWFVVRLAIFTP